MPVEGNIKVENISKFWFDEIRPPIDQALEIAPEDKFEWSPGPEMITLGNIFMHISEASDFWITNIIDHQDFTDFTPCPSLPKSEIVKLMDTHWRRLERFLDRAPTILETTYDHTWRGEHVKLSGTWIMLHLLEHDIHHRSQINHYLRILGIKPPRI
jgi:uncharacterized damage-inducible protein DinB